MLLNCDECWRRLLWVPWTARRSNQSILKEMGTEYSLERLMLKLKLQYFGYLMKRTDSLKARGERNGRGWDGWMASPTQWTWVWVNSGSWWWTGRPRKLQSMMSERVEHDWVTELNWTELKFHFFVINSQDCDCWVVYNCMFSRQPKCSFRVLCQIYSHQQCMKDCFSVFLPALCAITFLEEDGLFW